MVCINKLLFSFASNNVVMCFVVKILKSSVQWRGDEWNTENMRERDAGFMLAQCVLLNIENRRVTITNAQKKDVFWHTYSSTFYKFNETTKPCFIKINWCLTKKWWTSVGGTILDTRWWTPKWVSLKIVCFLLHKKQKQWQLLEIASAEVCVVLWSLLNL